MKKTLLWLMPVLMLAISACSGEEKEASTWFKADEISTLEMFELTDAEKKVNEDINRFGFDFANVVAQCGEASDNEETNFVVSPLSASYTLAMLANSGDDEVTSAVLSMFGQKDLEGFNTVNNKLLRYLVSHDDININNSVWYSTDFCQLNKDYPTRMNRLFYAYVNGVEFAEPEARNLMNAWVYDKTNGRINNFIKKTWPFDLTYFINTLQFGADWFSSFAATATNKADFKGMTYTSEVDMMYKRERAKYIEADDYCMLNMQVGDWSSMSLILPNEGVDIMDLSERFTYDDWKRSMDASEFYAVHLYLPRLSIKTDIDLIEAYKSMGLPEYIQGMDKLGKIPTEWFGKTRIMAFQNTAFDMDEKGVELSAASAINVLKTNIEFPDKEVTVKFDRPFMFVLYNSMTQSVIGVGRVCDL